jgi:DNA-binding ferritin-like protein
MKYGTMRKRSNQRGGRRTRARGGKPASASSLAAFESDVVCKFLEMLNNIKLYHWKTYSYATHKATDELYTSLGVNIDKFVEVLLGKAQNRIKMRTKNIPIKDMNSPQEFKREIESYKSYLVNLSNNKALGAGGMTNSDLLNIRDEILADLNQFLYLFTFK